MLALRRLGRRHGMEVFHGILARGLLSKIHIARQQLGLQDDVYRQKPAVMFGKGSARHLNLRQAEQLLTEPGRLGWQPQPSKRAAGKPHNFSQLPAEVQVIEAQLAEMRLPWSYADKIAKQMFGGWPKVAWLEKPESAHSNPGSAARRAGETVPPRWRLDRLCQEARRR
ncbi:DUF1018 domain-containing protein [Pseudomonas aeruginosa]|nr:DUF1018 domain-containing protein [Pseudomonas aeruginosa]